MDTARQIISGKIQADQADRVHKQLVQEFFMKSLESTINRNRIPTKPFFKAQKRNFFQRLFNL